MVSLYFNIIGTFSTIIQGSQDYITMSSHIISTYDLNLLDITF